MTPDEIRSLVRDELASLGGHLLATYGNQAERIAGTMQVPPSVVGITQEAGPHPLATLGGYLLENYGGEPDDTAGHVAYRDPEPPAVGEPPTTTPGSTE